MLDRISRVPKLFSQVSIWNQSQVFFSKALDSNSSTEEWIWGRSNTTHCLKSFHFSAKSSLNIAYFGDLLRFAVYEVEIAVPLSFQKIHFVPLRIRNEPFRLVNVFVVPPSALHVQNRRVSCRPVYVRLFLIIILIRLFVTP